MDYKVEKKDHLKTLRNKGHLVVSSLDFIFVSYFPNMKLKKPVTEKYRWSQTKKHTPIKSLCS